MSRRPRIALLAAMLLTLVAASVPGCGGDKGTNPGGGGGTKELDSGVLSNGGQYMHTFANAGTYNYQCNIHGVAMSGTVNVTGGGASTAVSIVDNAFNPPTVSIAPGNSVTWTNNGNNQHTVTSK